MIPSVLRPRLTSNGSTSGDAGKIEPRRRRHRLSCFLGAITLCSVTFPAFAANIFCSGSVDTLYVSSTGDVIFRPSYRNDYTEVCNVHGTWQDVSTETCFTWCGTLMAAKTHAKQVTLMYSTSTYTCATLPTYASAIRPSYVMVTN